MVEPGLNVVEGPYVMDILDQPRALVETLRHLDVPPTLEEIAKRTGDRAYARIVLTGMGSSLHALHPLHLRLVEAGLAPITVETSELLHYQRRLVVGGALLVLASQSGRSAEIVHLLEIARGHCDTVGVTNTADGPLARQATATLLTHAGEEATVSCKTYLAAQAVLAWLGTVLAGGDRDEARLALAEAVPGVGAYLADWRGHLVDLAGWLAGARALFYVGRGPSLAAAGSAGLITKEATHVPAEGMSSAAFRHGPLEMLDGSVFVLVFGGEARTRALNEGLVADVRAAGGRAFLTSEDAERAALRLPRVSDLARPVVELLPVEMITLALAALQGREAGRFDIAGKVTTKE